MIERKIVKLVEDQDISITKLEKIIGVSRDYLRNFALKRKNIDSLPFKIVEKLNDYFKRESLKSLYYEICDYIEKGD